jgi:hypothetical protein
MKTPLLILVIPFLSASFEATPSPTVRLFHGTEMKIRFEFDSPAQDTPELRTLYGFSDCPNQPSVNRARFAWRNQGGMLELMASSQENGETHSESLGLIEPNRAAEGSIALSSDRRHYVFKTEKMRVEMARGCTDERAFGVVLQSDSGGSRDASGEIRHLVNASGILGPVAASRPFPNPITAGRFSMNLTAHAPTAFFIRLVDSMGRIAWESPKTILRGGEQTRILYEIDAFLSRGTYMIYPFAALSDGSILPAAAPDSASGDAYRVLIAN